MKDWKKFAVIAILLAIIVIAIVWIGKWQFSGPEAPEWFREEMAQQEIDMIDEGTNEIMTKTRREWEELGRREGKYKNPNTGEYTMVKAMVCPACLQKIPAPVPPRGEHPTREEMIAFDQVLREYACPKCGARGIVGPDAASRSFRPPLPSRAK